MRISEILELYQDVPSLQRIVKQLQESKSKLIKIDYQKCMSGATQTVTGYVERLGKSSVAFTAALHQRRGHYGGTDIPKAQHTIPYLGIDDISEADDLLTYIGSEFKTPAFESILKRGGK